MNALISLLLIGFAAAQQPLTARSVVPALDSLKKTYEVPNFRIGGKYDVASSQAFENGAGGGMTLESLGANPARTAWIAVGTPKRNAKGEIVNAIVPVLGDPLRAIQAVLVSKEPSVDTPRRRKTPARKRKAARGGLKEEA